jgi:hypothetical protein
MKVYFCIDCENEIEEFMLDAYGMFSEEVPDDEMLCKECMAVEDE